MFLVLDSYLTLLEHLVGCVTYHILHSKVQIG